MKFVFKRRGIVGKEYTSLNFMKYMGLGSLTLFIFMFFSVFDGTVVWASSCEKPRISLEESYIQADVVFKGKVSSVGNQGPVFSIQEVFKTTIPNLGGEVSVSGFTEDAQKLKNKIGEEWIIYGKARVKEGFLLSVETFLDCDRSNYTIEQFLRHLNKDNSNTSEFIFRGKLRGVKSQWTKKNGSVSYPEFQLLEVLRNTTGFSVDKLKLDELYVPNCRREFELGEDYIVTLYPKVHPKKTTHKLYCNKRQIVRVSEEEILRGWAK